MSIRYNDEIWSNETGEWLSTIDNVAWKPLRNLQIILDNIQINILREKKLKRILKKIW